MRILLFDIDGTLIDSGGAGRRALVQSFREVCGLDNAMDGHLLAGKTDPLIIREALENNGIRANSEIIARLKGSYIKHLKKQMAFTKASLMPGVGRLLEALSNNGHRHMGLLTGNMEEGARIKLEPLGIFDYFSFGAYGSDDANRNRLLPHAQRRYAQVTGRDIPAEGFAVIGDTTRDVACAKPYGAMAIAVATGFHTMEQLRAAGPDVLLSDLSDTEGFIRLAS